MQVTETLSQGLKREYDISLPASDLAEKLNHQLAEMRAKAQIKGFRPGKVPMEHLRRIYGKSVMADVVQTAINTANKQIVDDNKLRLAREPRVDLGDDKSALEAALEARGDLTFKIALEVLPTFEVRDFSEIELDRLTTDISDAEVANAVERLADGRRTFADRGEGGKAEKGDRVSVDFDGKIDGVPFEGGEGRDIPVLIGSDTFIPGFEDQLVGAVAAEKRVVHATFPESYAVAALAGKVAEFDVTVKKVEAPEALAIDDEFAKGLGLESLAKLEEFVRDRMAADYARFSRDKIKRQLLDKLDALYAFDLPEGLVTQEFDGIWAQVMQEQQASGKSFADENTTEDAARVDYRRIAERRVRLGLLLAEIGTRANVQIPDDEISQAVVARARQFPGQEKQVWDFYRSNQQALAELRAPLYEEKVVDHILRLARVTEHKVSREELIKPIDDEPPAPKAAEPPGVAPSEAAPPEASPADQPAG